MTEAKSHPDSAASNTDRNAVASRFVPLWMRKGKDRDLCMRYWLEPHGQLVARNGGLHEYRQHHFHQSAMTLWPEVSGVRTTWTPGWMPDGMPEVTASLTGGPTTDPGVVTTPLILQDERNVFERSLMYRAEPGGSAWHRCIGPAAAASFRAVIFFRRRPGVPQNGLVDLLHVQMATILRADGRLSELRTATLLSYEETRQLWSAPDVLHEHPEMEQFHGVMVAAAESREQATAAFAACTQATGDLQSTVLGAALGVGVSATYVMVSNGQMTTTALRGASIEQIITRMGAESQRSADVEKLFSASRPPTN